MLGKNAHFPSAHGTEQSAPVGGLRLPLPLTIGVTGHRDIRDPERALEVISKVLDVIGSRFPHTPLQGLSPLAEGADRLFAQAVLDRGWPLDVVLPFERKLYEGDFPDSLEEFHELLRRARNHATLPLVAGQHTKDIESYGSDRNLHYARVGRHVAVRSQILLALWDGEEAEGLGGTAEIVARKILGYWPEGKEINHEDWNRLNQLEDRDFRFMGAGIVCWIPVHQGKKKGSGCPFPEGWPRWWSTVFEGVSPTTAKLINASGWKDTLPKPEEKKAGALMANLDRLDAYNRILVQERIVGESAKQDAVPRDAAERIEGYLGAADVLANRKMRDVRKLFAAVFSLAGLMALALEVWLRMISHWGFLVVYLLLLWATGALVWHIRRSRRDTEAVDYRALAEGLRVQQAWADAGMPEHVAQYYLRHYGPILQWVRLALQGVYPVPTDPQRIWERIEVISEQWILGQGNYYREHARKYHKILLVSRRISGYLYGLAVVTAALVLAASLPLWGEPFMHWSFREPVVILVGFFPALSAMIASYLEFSAYKEEKREYQQMAMLFGQGERYMGTRLPRDRQHRDHVHLHGLLHFLGIEALREHSDWVLVHKSHEIDIPKG